MNTKIARSRAFFFFFFYLQDELALSPDGTVEDLLLVTFVK